MNDSNASNALNALDNAQDGPIITPCRGCSDYDGYGGCKSKGGCARGEDGGAEMNYVWKHFKTVCKHKWIVFRECAACGIAWQGLTHDLSKFSPTEFIPSAKHFQGNRSPIEAEKDAVGYSAAWLHHKGRNPHHWEYWTDFRSNGEIIANRIPKKYIVEMVCDWIGAGKAYDSAKWTKRSPLDYYNKVRSGRYFHRDTEDKILDYLECIANDGLDAFHKMAKMEVQDGQ